MDTRWPMRESTISDKASIKIYHIIFNDKKRGNFQLIDLNECTTNGLMLQLQNENNNNQLLQLESASQST
jgi:hypothetical protein